MIRKLGCVGRVVIPSNMLNALDLRTGDKLLFELINNKIVITADKTISQAEKVKWALEYLNNLDNSKIKNDLIEILGDCYD